MKKLIAPSLVGAALLCGGTLMDAAPTVLFSDNFTGTGTADTMNLNYGLAGRQSGALGLIHYLPNGNTQVGNGGEPHDSGNVLLLAFGANASLFYNFNQAKSAGGLQISFDFDANSHTDWADTTTWAAVNFGAAMADRFVGVSGAETHFGILFRADGRIQAFDGSTVVSPEPTYWAGAGAGNYSGELHHVDIQVMDFVDGNPFDGFGDAQIDIYVDGSATSAFTYTKTGGFTDNYINFQGEHIADIDNLAITQLDPPTPPAEPWSVAEWLDDASSGADATYNYTHAYNFGRRAAVINNLMYSGIWVGNPSVSGRFSFSGPGSRYPNDTGNVLSGGGSRVMANDFLYGGNPGTLTLNGLTPGTQYVLSFYSTRWEGVGNRLITFASGSDQRTVDQDAFGTASRNGIIVSYAYTATSDTMIFTATPLIGGNTFHCYGFANREVTPSTSPNPWSYAEWTSDSTTGVNPAYNYTHAYTLGGLAAATTINTIPFTAAGGGNPSVSGKFSVTGVGNAFGADGGAAVTGDSAVMAGSFIYGGSPGTLTLQGLTPGTQYVLSLFSTAWEGAGARFIGFSSVTGQKVIDQDTYDTASVRNGIVVSYAYTADAAGTAIIQTSPLTEGATFHMYGFCNRETTPKPMPPQIMKEPQSTYAAEGLDVKFSVEAIGEPAPTYLWYKGETALTTETAPSLTLAAVTPASEGDYQVVVSNAGGSVTSVVATLKVGLPMVNPSFEIDTFTNWPGYIGGGATPANFPITGWTASLVNMGINPGTYLAGGTFGPFADNGAVPHGKQVAFMQGDGSLSTTVSGLTPGVDYQIVFYENARNCCGGVAALDVTVNDGVNPSILVVPTHPVTAVLSANPYRLVKSAGFTAQSTSCTVTFTKSQWTAGDDTVLLDNVCVVLLPPNTPPAILMQPKSTIASLLGTSGFNPLGSGSPPLSYQWLKDGVAIAGATGPSLSLSYITQNDDADYQLVITNSAGAATSSVAHITVALPLADLFDTGVDASRAPLAGGSVDPHYALTVNPDSGSVDALVQSHSVIGGAWMANSAASTWIGPRVDTSGAAGGDYTYSTSFDLTGRDPSTVVIEGNWTSDNAGLDIAVNGTSTGIKQDGNFAAWYAFNLAAASGTFIEGPNQIDFKVNNAGAGYTGLRVEFSYTHAKFLPGTAPKIVTQPTGRQAAIGESALLVANGVGSTPLYFQWHKDGVALTGQTGPTLELSSLKAIDTGLYTLVVSNEAGIATSAPAAVCVNMERVPGIYGTGVDDTGALLPNSAFDMHYALSSPDPTNAGPTAYVVIDTLYPIPPWMASGPNSKWIAPLADQSVGNLPGTYTYQTWFNLSGVDLTRFKIMGAWGVDNTGVDILVNGVSTGIANSSGFAGLTSFTISSGFVDGDNSLDFIVYNDGTAANPTALRVDLTGYLTLPPTMSVTQSGSSVTVTWTHAVPCQRLQSAPAVSGPWTDVVGATIVGDVGYYTTATTEPAMFFRIAQ